MKLIKFSYKSENWELNEMAFNTINLIVGKNAVGKSRTLDALNTISSLIAQKSHPAICKDCTSTIELKDNETSIRYSFSIPKNIILEEKLWVNGELYLERTEEGAKIKSFLSGGEYRTIQPPKNRLTLHVHRDTKEYPFFESIMSWVENFYSLAFGNITNKGSSGQILFDMANQDELLFEMYKPLDIQSGKNIIDNLSSLEFKIKNIQFETWGDLLSMLLITEEGAGTFSSNDLSQGMYRALYILVFMEYLSTKKEPQTIIIDDLCEGMDYNRATKLGKLLFKFCEEKDIQLIASSNDGFLMDVVDLKYWNILQRNEKKVFAINYANSKELFDGFKFTGLSNFDFFSSDYILRNN